MRARFCTQCQVSFRPKNSGFPNTMVSDFEYFVVIWCNIRTKSRKRKKPLHGCISHWKTSLVSLLNSLVHQCWPLRSPPRHKEDQNKISKKKNAWDIILQSIWMSFQPRKSTWNSCASIIFRFWVLFEATFPPQLYNLKTCKLATLAPCIPQRVPDKGNMPFSAFLWINFLCGWPVTVFQWN
jgi:hypothetical protein